MPLSSGPRVSSFIRKSESLTSRLQLPEKLKGGRIERYVNYWKGVKTDYKEALKELGQSCRERPIKASMIGATILSALYANRHNPDEKSFNDLLVNINNDLTMVSDLCRNNSSTQHQFEVVRAQNAGVLRYWNFGIFSIIWKDNYNSEFSHVKARCKYLTVGYTDVLFKERERIVDIGFLGNWWYTNKAMEEYDINQDEWDIAGKPRNTKDQLKPMW